MPRFDPYTLPDGSVLHGRRAWRAWLRKQEDPPGAIARLDLRYFVDNPAKGRELREELEAVTWEKYDHSAPETFAAMLERLVAIPLPTYPKSSTALYKGVSPER